KDDTRWFHDGFLPIVGEARHERYKLGFFWFANGLLLAADALCWLRCHLIGNALVHRRETEQVPALYLTRFACGGLGKLSRALEIDAGASDGDGLSRLLSISLAGPIRTHSVSLISGKGDVGWEPPTGSAWRRRLPLLRSRMVYPFGWSLRYRSNGQLTLLLPCFYSFCSAGNG
ncbi:MAG: hypothetical protein WCB50_23945, partial [Pseudolabrys sp.]